MPVSRLKFESLPHAIFLQRVSGPESATTLEARLGQGAFLALRLVDLLAPDRGPVSQDAFHYQWVATDRFCRELLAAATEGAHVHGIVESASGLYRLGDIQLVSPAIPCTCAPSVAAARSSRQKDRKSTRLNSSHANNSYDVF